MSSNREVKLEEWSKEALHAEAEGWVRRYYELLDDVYELWAELKTAEEGAEAWKRRYYNCVADAVFEPVGEEEV